jgi:tRNA A-37 threonylcarbamoyl transferase component Bud32
MDVEQAALELVDKVIADKYRLTRLLGMGGMGAVYEAEHVFTKRRVALKRMHPGIARSRIAAERFVRESQAPSTIGHPGIVQVLDGGIESDGSLYLVLELLEGVSMNDALDEGALEPAGVVQIGIELLEALAAAHDKGFIHRDIKPDNIFLAGDGRDGVVVKLLDFGIASVRDTGNDVKLTQVGSVLGTPLYMSPEQAKGAEIDLRSDLWSVGAMLYRALAGTSPYEGESFNALIVSIVTREHVPLSALCPNLPKTLIRVVERALRKDPGERYQSALEMADALRAVRFQPDAVSPAKTANVAARRAPAAIAAAPAWPAMSTRRDETSSSWVGLLLGAGALLALAALLFFVLRPKDEPASDSRRANTELQPADDSHAPAEQVAEDPALAAAEHAEPTEPTEREAPSDPQQPAAPQPPIAAAQPDAVDSEPLSGEIIGRVIAEQQGAMQSCLEDAMVAEMLAGGKPPPSLRLDVQLRISAAGPLERVEVTGEGSTELRNCVQRRLSNVSFPKSGAPTTFRYPLLFTPKVLGQ